MLAPLAVHVQAGCSAFPFYIPTKLFILIYMYFKYKNVLNPKLKIIFIFLIFIIKCKYKQKIQLFFNVHGIMNTSGLLQSK